MVINLMISAKVAILGLLKTMVFWKKGYDVIITSHDVINKILSRDSNYIVDVVMWSKTWDVIIRICFYKDLTRKNAFFFEGWSLFKFNNVGLALGTNLKFYTNLAKGLKLKVKMFWELTPTFVELTGENLVGGPFCTPLPPPFWIGLKSY